MIAVAFVRWWYGAGWKQLQANTRRRLERTALSFSVPTLARTLFAPWKRIVAIPGAGIGAHLQAASDNAISRLVGFTVRLIVLLTAGVCLVAVALGGLLQIILWPVLPLAAIACLAGGLL